MTALDLDDLDAGRSPKPFLVRAGGQTFRFPPASEIPWQKLFYAAYHPPALLAVGFPDGCPDELLRLPGWKAQRLCKGYRAYFGIPDDPGESQRLAALIQSYGAAIEYDLAVRCNGMDLATEWKARRWRKLLNIIDRLPRDSAYVEAVSDDDRLADELVKREDPKDQPLRKLSDWSAEVELLTALVDRVGELIQVIVAVNGAKPGKVHHAPRPVTAFDRARARQRVTRHRDLVSRVLPREAGPPT